MTAQAWITTTWGRIRETLQPDLFALRQEVRSLADEVRRLETQAEDAMTLVVCERRMRHADQIKVIDLTERLARRSQDLKAARAALKRASA